MKRLLFFIALMVIAVPGFSQDKEKVEKQDKTQAKKADVEEIQLDALHLDATVEKPSVSILPRRLKPELEQVEFIIRDFDRELKMLPEELFSMKGDKRSFTKIRDVQKLIARDRN
ncbi:MAG: hypothetical protein V3U73_12530 [bacterium]